MKTTILGSLLSGLALVAPVHAQQVAGDIFVRSGPVAGHVRIGDSYSTYRAVPVVEYRRAPVRRVAVYERRAPRVIVVERARHHHHFHHWQRDGFRRVTLYYVDGRYYDRYLYGRPGIRAIVVYERDGRYYRDHDHRRDRHDRHDRDHYRDRSHDDPRR